jgi:Cu+-exporting ATPase
VSKNYIELGIDGMTCASCASRVERGLVKLAGVEHASVNLASERAVVEVKDPNQPVQDVIQAVELLGYIPRVAEVEIAVDGMTCANCSARVERTLNRHPAVVEASVNLATEKAWVRYVPASIDVDGLMQLISDVGYQPRLVAEQQDQEEAARTRSLTLLRRNVILSFALSVPVLFLSMGADMVASIDAWLTRTAPFTGFWVWVQFILTSLVIAFPGRRFFRTGWIAYRHFSPDMNSLVMTGTGAAWLYSSLVLFMPDLFPEAARHVFFESSAVVISIVLLGKYLEERAKGKASSAIKKLLGLQVRDALVIRNGEKVVLPISQIVLQDRVIVKPGDRIPVDGRVVAGEGYIDESMLTGEPLPVQRGPGDELSAGTLNQNGHLQIEVIRIGKKTVLSQIIAMVEQAQAGKLPIQSLADKVILVFTPVVLGIALVTLIAWLIVGPEPVLTHALIAMVSVLVIACPCAMGLATPAAIMVGTGRAAELGVLFRKGEALERLNRVDQIIFDKTGTLTVGSPKVIEIQGEDQEEAMRLAASVEQGSEHPLASAIVEVASDRGLKLSTFENFEAHPGKGVSAEVEGHKILIGNGLMMQAHQVDIATRLSQTEAMTDQGWTPVYVANDGVLMLLIGIADPPRSESRAVVADLLAAGIKVTMLTGDNRKTAESLGSQLGIEDVVSEVLPADKAHFVTDVKQNHAVAFVGDGINDAPALAEADVGIAMGSGTDIAVESADVVLVGGRLGHVLTALTASRKTVRTIKGNLFWAFIYNILLIPVAAGVLYPFMGVLLNPMLAGAAMGFSSIFVVLNSLRLRQIPQWVSNHS